MADAEGVEAIDPTSTIKDFDILQQVGSGTFCVVNLCRKKDSGRVFVVKQLSKKKIVYLKQVVHVTQVPTRSLLSFLVFCVTFLLRSCCLAGGGDPAAGGQPVHSQAFPYYAGAQTVIPYSVPSLPMHSLTRSDRCRTRLIYIWSLSSRAEASCSRTCATRVI